MFLRTSPDIRSRRNKDYDLEADRDRDRERDRENEPDSARRDKDRDRDRHKSSRKSSSRKLSSTSSRDFERSTSGRDRRPHRSYSGSYTSSRKMATGIPEMNRRTSTTLPNNNSQTSLAYPPHSKAHSREVVTRDSHSNPRTSPYTPDPTDLGGDVSKSAELASGPSAAPAAPPPSPPLTSVEPDLRRAASANSMRRRAETEGIQMSSDNRSRSHGEPRSTGSRSSLKQSAKAKKPAESRSSTPASKHSDTSRRTASVNEPSTVTLTQNPHQSGGGSTTGTSQRSSTITQSTTDSDVTVAFDDPRTRKTPSHNVPLASLSGSSAVDSSPRTPTVPESILEVPLNKNDEQPSVDVFPAGIIRTVSAGVSPHMPIPSAPPPPPPPPPPPGNVDPPRVDYLLQNGGLPRPVTRNFLAAALPATAAVPSYLQYVSPQPQNSAQTASASSIFSPLQQTLEEYRIVMGKKGSIAVATGYRSVARRLLDRLEAVFARNISSESCHCILCRHSEHYQESGDASGISWGEILEFVSGRRELPQWPPFAMVANESGLGMTASALEMPMQKLDIDVPEEYKEHYVRQSKKTQKSVQAWLASQPEMPSSPPQDVDDETLTFAILTYLEPEQRPLFTALLHGMTVLPVSRAPTPLNTAKPELLNMTGLAIQRLYRLPKPPRDAESTLYLLKNPSLHGVLVTLAAVSAGEWDILVSGRFDGFLWSGAETSSPPNDVGSPPPGGGPSRGPTPASRTMTPFGANRGAGTPFRTTTPAGGNNVGAPVQMDEETEIAVLAEVEREIFLGMEALEDAFEKLHNQAEQVRRALRERSAGLAMAAQARRGSSHNVEARLGTPASCLGTWDEEDGGWDDGQSILSLAPDDSASNIGFKRRKRREGRERTTPAPVEEEDEGVIHVDTPYTKKSSKSKW